MSWVTVANNGQLFVELSEVRWWMRLYVLDLIELLGPEPQLPDDPLAALAATAAGDPERPSDPVLARLLPDGVLDDDAAATEFRRFTHESLLSRKRASAMATLRILEGPPRQLDPSEAHQLLGGINDLRLMLGTRLMVSEDDEFRADDPSGLAVHRSYLMLGWLQEQVLDALMT